MQSLMNAVSPAGSPGMDTPRDRVAVDAAGIGGRDLFLLARQRQVPSIRAATAAWNDAVASAVGTVAHQHGLIAQRMGEHWFRQVQQALKVMDHPLHSDVILAGAAPFLANDVLTGRVKVFGATMLSEDPEFMPSTQYEWPRFPYFVVEPGTPRALHEAGLVLLTNPPAEEEDEANLVGAPIAMHNYGKSPMVSVELDVNDFTGGGAVLINWSCRGRLGAKAKIFIDGELDVPAFTVASSDEDRTPNFWTILPLRPGKTMIDLKLVGSGMLWFEHADIHSVTW